MAKFKNITPDTRYIAYGLASPRGVLPDSVVEVDDDAAEGYADQVDIWQAADSTAKDVADRAAVAKATAEVAAAELARAEAEQAAADAALAADATASDAPSTPSEG